MKKSLCKKKLQIKPGCPLSPPTSHYKLTAHFICHPIQCRYGNNIKKFLCVSHSSLFHMSYLIGDSLVESVHVELNKVQFLLLLNYSTCTHNVFNVCETD